MPTLAATRHEPTIVKPANGQLNLPHGYAFVRKGNVYITKNCRNLTHKANHTVYVVQASNGKPIGIAVPSTIYSQVQQLHTATSAARAAAVAKKDATVEDAFQAELLRLFPEMPGDRVALVTKHTLKKRSGRVGRTTKLALDKVVVFAVRAHIRHKLTDYDAMLRRGVDRDQARKDVRGAIDELARKWSAKAKTKNPTGRVEKRKYSLPTGSVVKKLKSSPVKKAQLSPLEKATRKLPPPSTDHDRMRAASKMVGKKALSNLDSKRPNVLRTSTSGNLAQQPRRRSLRIEEKMLQTSRSSVYEFDAMGLD